MSILSAKGLWSDFLSLFYPRLCIGCDRALGSSETDLCFECISSLPRTGMHSYKDNIIEQRFYCYPEIAAATSLLFFEKGTVSQKILHEIKYHGNHKMAIWLGRFLGEELKSAGRFDSVDCIIPVPLHKNRLRVRGYNQSEMIARGLSLVLEKPVVPNALRRTEDNTSQTQKNTTERSDAVSGIFRLNDASLVKQKHILLVDDVLTTGATLMACIDQLITAGDVKISVATIAAVQ